MLYLCQLVCPKGHRLAGALYDDAKQAHAVAEKALTDYAKSKSLICGICGSHDSKTIRAESSEQQWSAALKNVQQAEAQRLVANILAHGSQS